MLYNDMTIPIRTIQHFIYCPHRWGLLSVDMSWAENEYVTKANIFHKHVHTQNKVYSKPGVMVYHAVPVYNDNPEIDIYGVLDCLEISEDNEGKQDFAIVEYKPTTPKNSKYNYDDMMQVFAQKTCVDYMFDTDAKAYIYYADKKKRVQLPFSNESVQLKMDLLNVLASMRMYLNEGIVPKVNKNVHCGGCSLKNICIPSLLKVSCGTVKSRIEKIGRCSE